MLSRAAAAELREAAQQSQILCEDCVLERSLASSAAATNKVDQSWGMTSLKFTALPFVQRPAQP
ncbi:hypothetical protein TMM008_47670 [Pseudomonas sp. 008]|nr:hypothetical protein TMM008_47670 [Pseudomonas sp. 008]